MEAGPRVGPPYRCFGSHSYRINQGSVCDGKTLSAAFPGLRIFVERVRRDGKIIDSDEDMMLHAGDVSVISGRREVLVENVDPVLEEINDRELLDFSAEKV